MVDRYRTVKEDTPRGSKEGTMLDHFGAVEVETKKKTIRIIGYGGRLKGFSGVHLNDPTQLEKEMLSEDYGNIAIFGEASPHVGNPIVNKFGIRDRYAQQQYTKYNSQTASVPIYFRKPRTCVISAKGLVPESGESWHAVLFQSPNAKVFHPELATIDEIRIDCPSPAAVNP